MTHICVGKQSIIDSDNGLSPGRRQAIIWTKAGILLIGPLGTNFSEILIKIQTFSLKKIRLKMSSAKCSSRPQCVKIVCNVSRLQWVNLSMCGFQLCVSYESVCDCCVDTWYILWPRTSRALQHCQDITTSICTCWWIPLRAFSALMEALQSFGWLFWFELLVFGWWNKNQVL